MYAALKERNPENRHCLRCGSKEVWSRTYKPVSEAVCESHCTSCGFVIAEWGDGFLQISGDGYKDWIEVPEGCLVVVNSEPI